MGQPVSLLSFLPLELAKDTFAATGMSCISPNGGDAGLEEKDHVPSHPTAAFAADLARRLADAVCRDR
ncbi:hypothetical protein GCM10022213_27650 [Parerythrobacter jejuensis]